MGDKTCEFTVNVLRRPGMTIWGEQGMLASGLSMERNILASPSDQIWPSLKWASWIRTQWLWWQEGPMILLDPQKASVFSLMARGCRYVMVFHVLLNRCHYRGEFTIYGKRHGLIFVVTIRVCVRLRRLFLHFRLPVSVAMWTCMWRTRWTKWEML